jgi:cephalosporin-C deacetylase-like acetyl esterase
MRVLLSVVLLLITRTVFPQQNNFNKKEYLNNLIEVIEKDGGRSYPLNPLQVDPTWEKDLKLYSSLKAFFIHNNNNWGSPTPLDATWIDWLERTGELPPDFDELSTIALLPDPLIIVKGDDKTPVTTTEQWEEQKKWIKEQAQKWILGTLPPPPDNLIYKVIEEQKSDDVTRQLVELRFGPDRRARLRLVLLIPPGKGPFPVFLTQYNHQSSTLLALRRGYLTCAYAATDDLDDTEEWAEIYYPQYDFSRLMRRAWAAGRAIDYLYTLPFVDKGKIGLTGHSRNGKVSLYAAAFDERITAVMPAGCGSGAETPWRYTSERYGAEDIRTITGNFPNWYHPRFRFFSGRENKLPIDNNSLQALIAPRGLFMSLGIGNGIGNWMGTERSYNSVKRVYQLLGAENNLHLNLRDDSETDANAMEEFIDFCDYVFGRSNYKAEEKFYFNYSFDKWKILSGETINPHNYPENELKNLLTDSKGKKISTVDSWENKKKEIRNNLEWSLGERPPRAVNPGPGEQKDYISDVLKKKYISMWNLRTQVVSSGVGAVDFTDIAQKSPSSQFHSFSDHQTARLYYPIDEDGKLKGTDLPVLIFLHGYNYTSGTKDNRGSYDILYRSLVENDIAVFTFDFIGFGSRVKEGTRFYERFPRWSRMGSMVDDVRSAVDACRNLPFIGQDKIYAGGFSLGGSVALYAAALDDRIAGVASLCGLTPLRIRNAETVTLYGYSHIDGLMPRLGFFTGNENRLPFDYDEVLSSVAPRPVFIESPKLDQYVDIIDVEQYVNQVSRVYDLYAAKTNLEFHSPETFCFFSSEMQDRLINWIKIKTKK